MKNEGITGLIEELLGKIRRSIFLRICFLGILITLLNIPIFMIDSTVRERQTTRDSAIREVTETWGSAQTVAGPVVVIPYLERTTDDKGVFKETVVRSYFLPERLSFSGTVNTEVRKRGIFDVPLYTTHLKISGNFIPPVMSSEIAPKDVLWDHASICLGVSDPKALQSKITLNWYGKTLAFEPGVANSEFLVSGIHVSISNLRSSMKEKNLPFTFELDLHGSSELWFLPFGSETNANLTSQWPHPSFMGSYLPNTREVTSNGFSASWRVLNLGRNYPQHFSSGEVKNNEFYSSRFGVGFLSPTDAYRMTSRSVKYYLLFLCLTFLLFFLFELFYRLRIHPVQYLLVGFALCLFYLLLLSLSEFISFGMGYTVASFSTVCVICGYCSAIFGTGKRTATLTAMLSFLYAFLFILLKMQDYSLMAGSIGLFATLGGVMFLTRNVDWYNVGDSTLPEDKIKPTRK